MADAQKLFEILVRENSDMLAAYLRAAVRDAATADDIFQETLLVAWRRLDDYDTSRPFGPWLRGIAAKLLLAFHRKSAKRDEIFGPSFLEQLDVRFERFHRLPGDTFDEKLDALRRCIDLLPAKYREPIDLRYEQELEIPTAAERLSVGVEALQKRLQRARARLRECLNRRLVAAEAN